MEKLDSGLSHVLYANYFNFQFSYLHTFCKSNNTKTTPSTEVKLIFKFSTIIMTDKGFNLDSHGV